MSLVLGQAPRGLLFRAARCDVLNKKAGILGISLGDLPPDADDLVSRCLAQDPKGRPQSAAEFLEGIEETLRAMATALGGAAMGREEALVGHTLGAYRLVDKLGRGGMAAVYKAYEPTLDRYVAIKVLPQHFAHDPTFLTRFRREAKAIARLNHPNIVPVFNFGEEGDLTYIVACAAL